MLIAMGLLATAITTLGIRPQIVLEGVVAPGLHTWGLHSELIEHYLEVSFLSWADIQSVIIAFAIGFTVFFVGMKFGLFHLHAPKWFGVDFWYVKGAQGFVALCRWVDDWYELLRKGTSRLLWWLRLHYRSEWSRLERDARRFVLTVLTGAPGPRNQHFVQRSYIVLERERQATVRFAVVMAVEWLHDHPDYADDAYYRGHIDAVRDISSYMATRLFKERLGVVSDFIRADEADAVCDTFERVVRSLSIYRDRVGRTALLLAEKRMLGENVLRDISAAMNRILSEERFDQKLRESIPHTFAPSGRLLQVGQSAMGAVPSAAQVSTYRVEGLSRLERTGVWITDMARLIVETATQERVSWMAESRATSESVLDTRRQIQRYARDMSFNVAIVFVVLLVFLASLVGNL